MDAGLGPIDNINDLKLFPLIYPINRHDVSGYAEKKRPGYLAGPLFLVCKKVAGLMSELFLHEFG
jgi:hypothetical protein